MKALYGKLIFCGNCGSGMKRKIERGKIKYLCSRHAANSEVCSRKALIEEEFLTSLIYKRYGELSNEELRSIIDRIIVKDKMEFEIEFTNGDQSILFSDSNFIRY